MDGPGRTFTHHGQWPINGTGPPGTPTLNMDIFPPPAALNLRLTCPKLIVARFSFITQNIFHLLIYMVYYIDTASYILFLTACFIYYFFFSNTSSSVRHDVFQFPWIFFVPASEGEAGGSRRWPLEEHASILGRRGGRVSSLRGISLAPLKHLK